MLLQVVVTDVSDNTKLVSIFSNFMLTNMNYCTSTNGIFMLITYTVQATCQSTYHATHARNIGVIHRALKIKQSDYFISF